MTVIYTSHYMEEVEYLCKRIAIVDHGKLIALGTKDELKEKSKAKDTLTVIYSNGDKGALDKIKSINGIENVSISNNQISMLVDQHKRNIIDIVEDVRNLGVKLTSFKYEEVNLESIFFTNYR